MLACAACGAELPAAAKFCLDCGAKVEASVMEARDTRRRVTVLFADVSGSTRMGEQLDPETLREVIARYFSAMRLAIEHHGGTVEKFIGDAVMAVFGLPQLHEDDALRASRAALEMQQAVASLNSELRPRWSVELQIRIGINTGEVVAGDVSARQLLVTGDAVNTAARLEQTAQPGEILLGADTYALVRNAASAFPVEAINAKGKAEPVPAWRLDSVEHADPFVRLFDQPIVGRDREIRLLLDAAERGVEDRSCALVTVIGVPGVGKSRLVHEFVERALREPTGARVIRGRCLSYGTTTYWPLLEALRDAAGIAADEDERAITDKLSALAGEAKERDAVVGRVQAAIGLAGGTSGGPEAGAETFWAVRRLFEAMARHRPLVAVFDDVQWATPTFLDLLEHLAEWVQEVPALLLVVARPELFEARPSWGGGIVNATTIQLEPLRDEAVGRMVDNLPGGQALPAALRRQIADTAEGNPLFVEQLLASLRDDGVLKEASGAWHMVGDVAEVSVPPTVELLVASRVDRLPASDKRVLERASVIGKRFGAAAVTALAPPDERASVRDSLLRLQRKEHIRPDTDPSEPGAGDDDVRFRFRHQLIRDAAYEALPKHERASLHEAFAAWLQSMSRGHALELHEILAHHYDQAYRYRLELGADPLEVRALAESAAQQLMNAATRAQTVGDRTTAIGLLERVRELLPHPHPDRLKATPMLAMAVYDTGDVARAAALLGDLREMIDLDPALRAAALEASLLVDASGGRIGDPLVHAEEALAIRRRLGDPRGIASAMKSLAEAEFFVGQLTRARALLDEATSLAATSGDHNLEIEVRGSIARVMTIGMDRREDIEAKAADDLSFADERGTPFIRARALFDLGVARAMADDPIGARAANEEAMSILADLGLRMWVAGHKQVFADTLSYHDLDSAIVVAREGVEELQRLGELGWLASSAADLALFLLDTNRREVEPEVEELLALSEAIIEESDVSAMPILRAARARLSARHGEFDTAMGQAETALNIALAAEFGPIRRRAYDALAEVLELAQRPAEAAAVLERSLAEQEARNDTVMARRARERIARLRSSG